MTTFANLKETYAKLMKKCMAYIEPEYLLDVTGEQFELMRDMMKLSDDAFKLIEEQDEKLNDINKKTDEILELLKKKA